MGVLLGVVQRTEGAQLARGERVVVEQHARGHERPGEAAAAGLVGARHEAHAEPAVEREQALTARAPGARRRRRAESGRC